MVTYLSGFSNIVVDGSDSSATYLISELLTYIELQFAGDGDIWITNGPIQATLPTILTGSLPDAQAGRAYSFQMNRGTTGVAPYVWSATNLPSGMVINPTSGILSGTPTNGSVGQSQPTVILTDSLSRSASRVYLLVVLNPATSYTARGFGDTVSAGEAIPTRSNYSARGFADTTSDGMALTIGVYKAYGFSDVVSDVVGVGILDSVIIVPPVFTPRVNESIDVENVFVRKRRGILVRVETETTYAGGLSNSSTRGSGLVVLDQEVKVSVL